MTASICFSGTTMTLPTLSSSPTTAVSCSGSTWRPGATADIASFTSIGVFGMTRTTGTPAGSAFS
ncbi:Uncharacterised protein [Mycobacteroides abscessus subsp. abscessus]|nr:Uncharacterised protein [Mycobacteroides abscessus subsp. abscessus]